MQPDFIQGSLLLEIIWAICLVIISAFVAWLIRFGVRRLEHRLEERGRRQTLLPQLLDSLTRPLFLLIVAEGLLLALSSLEYLAPWEYILGKARIAVVIIMVTYAVATCGGVLLAWYLTTTTVRRKARVDEGIVRFLRRTILLIVFAIGILILLDYLSISITPIIAGLGVGGLAVALALQPTLANFFAGTQIVSDRVVRVGDYIELDDGSSIRGFVTDVGWRSTRIRTPFNNLIIIPNSRLAESVITNYYGPTMEMGITISCGVSYNANLPQVEAIARDVANHVIEELDEADKTFEPWVIFEEFGDSNINFMIWLRAKDRLGSFRLRSEIIKRLKAALDKEGIMINYPARLLTFDPETMPPAFKESFQNQGKRGKKD
jgi:small-conductance mechanosensitive channel